MRDLRMQLEFIVGKGDNSDLGNSAKALLSALPTDPTAFLKAREGATQFAANLAPLGNAADNVLATFEAQVDQRTINTALFAIFASLVLTLLVVVVKIFNEEAAERNIESESLRERAETERNASQEAILRLMNEMGDLADGDLTVRATVTEDITGAIADSVNYTVEELSVLVKRINDAATRVTGASAAAQNTTDELLSATETQSQEIRSASSSVLDMAQSMTNVSVNASESARVALNALSAAQKGSAAVTNSIKGMNEIRQQIQETSKRIKRLGESSQEIGEIVELISDITEQTNVLALNAAIQAASAGEAGRGFTVVAEEVQRLAERSAEATKQIAAIVKTIQTDTHDAVSAMENSTQGVVEGAQLSDAAGQALEEISNVSKNLADLIQSISGDTEKQAAVATDVAKLMQNILHITEQTTTGTRQTAGSIGELAELASELKGSVSGFKV
jgi:twitching motility protein PilJ